MDLAKVLAELRFELETLDAAILSLERLQEQGQGRRRGRPPKILSEMKRSEQPPVEDKLVRRSSKGEV